MRWNQIAGGINNLSGNMNEFNSKKNFMQRSERDRAGKAL